MSERLNIHGQAFERPGDSANAGSGDSMSILIFAGEPVNTQINPCNRHDTTHSLFKSLGSCHPGSISVHDHFHHPPFYFSCNYTSCLDHTRLVGSLLTINSPHHRSPCHPTHPPFVSCSLGVVFGLNAPSTIIVLIIYLSCQKKRKV